jgi:hypothetical protein
MANGSPLQLRLCLRIAKACEETFLKDLFYTKRFPAFGTSVIKI